MDNPILVYQGQEHRIKAILALISGTAPQFTVKETELIVAGHPLWGEIKLEVKGDVPALNAKQVVVTKYKTGYVVLLGNAEGNVKESTDGNTVMVTLISNHALKRARVLDESAVVEVPRSNPRPNVNYGSQDRPFKPRRFDGQDSFNRNPNPRRERS